MRIPLLFVKRYFNMNEKNKKDIDWFSGVILFLTLGVVPAIVRMSNVTTRPSELGVLRAAEKFSDAFGYYKMSILFVLAVLLAVYCLLDIDISTFKTKIKKPVVFLPMIFILLSLVSAILSPYKDVAFNGASERYEGFWMWAVYMMFFAVTMSYVDCKQHFNILMAGFVCGVLIVGGIGVGQAFGHDIYSTDFGAKFVLGNFYNPAKGMDKLTIRFDSVFSTLYNPNCMGIYTGMLCPFFLVASLFTPFKNKWKYVFAVMTVILLINLFGCDSVGGFLGFTVSLVFTGIVSLVYILKNGNKALKITVPIVIIVGIAVCGAVVFKGNSKIVQKLNIIQSAISNSNEIENPYFFENIELNGNKADLYTKEGIISLSVENDMPKVEVKSKADDAEIQVLNAKKVTVKEELRYYYTIPGLVESYILFDNNLLLFAGGDGKTSTTRFYFDTSNGSIQVLDQFGNAVDLNKEYPRVGFEGMERLGSNRGYIWSRSIPLIKKHIILGEGPDCFEFEFPHQDLKGKLQYLGNPNIILDKPHNFYLQVAINTGLISLLVLLALFVVYIVQTIKAVLTKKDDNFMLGLRLGAMSGVTGYLVAVMTTDSMIVVSPVFWILLGMGFALNKVNNLR